MSNLAANHKDRLEALDLRALARPKHDSPELAYAVVVSVEKDALVLEGPSGRLTASRAASCLLRPEKNDRVLAVSGQGANWILAVLERPENTDAILSFEGDVRLQSEKGSIHMAAAESISTLSQNMAVHSEKASMIFGSFHLAARVYNSCIDKATTVMEKVDLFCRNMRQTLAASYKRVEGHEEEHAATRRIVTTNMSMKSQTTEIAADERVSVNSSQFHVN